MVTSDDECDGENNGEIATVVPVAAGMPPEIATMLKDMIAGFQDNPMIRESMDLQTKMVATIESMHRNQLIQQAMLECIFKKLGLTELDAELQVAAIQIRGR